MDFNLDDPLGDLLSDGSNDSFFETAPKKKGPGSARPGTAKSTTTAIAKGKMEDLFGIESKDPSISVPEAKTSSTVSIEPPSIKRPQEVPKPKLTSTKSESILNDDDIISDLGFDPKKPKSAKSNIFSDLLSPVETKKISTTSTPVRPLTTGGIPREEKKVISRQSTETTESTVPGTYTASLPRPKTAGRRPSITSLNDPLGFFGPTQTKEKDSKVKKKGSTADWLGLSSEAKSEKDPAQVEIPPPAHKEVQQPQILTTSEPAPNFSLSLPQTTAANQSAILMAAANLETQNALQTMKQQEVQIAIASQVKNQEIALLEMQKRQQDLLTQQEAQFNALLQKQIQKQNQLEATIRAQQERINAHIQLLLTQSGISAISNDYEPQIKKRVRKTVAESGEHVDDADDINLKVDVKRLELEKLRLEDLVSNINANHEKEIEFMELSHKKQIQVLEENIHSLETRLQNEIKSLEDFYAKKLETMKNEADNLVQNYEQKLKSLKEENEAIVQKLKTNHENDLEALKEDHRRMIENIRQSKLIEFSVVQENTSYLETLRNAANYLENASGDLQTLRDEMYKKVDFVHKERELKLEAREKRLEDAERRLKMSEEATEQEKTRLIDLVTTLENQLNKSNKERDEENWNLKKQISNLEAERTSFEKEKQFIREQLTREEKRIEEIKQWQLEENQRLMQQIQDERQVLITEKMKLETAKRLQQTSEQSKPTQNEFEASLKVAEEATRQADQERDRYYKMQRTLEGRRRELIEQENNIRHKQDELEASICSVKAKERRIEEALHKNRLAEQDFNIKLQMLHSQIRQVTEREARISQERLILSKERLEVQELKQKLDQNKCSLCKIGERSAEISKLLIQENFDEKPLTETTNYMVNNIFHSKFDTIIDKDVTDSLKKIENINISTNLQADLDTDGVYELNNKNFIVPSINVPTNLLDSEIAMLNFDIKTNFDI